MENKSNRIGIDVQNARGFYGRRAGKSLNERQALLMKDFLKELAIDIEVSAPKPLKDLFSKQVESVWLESGFGGGEHLIHRAKENPTIGYIGVEPFRNGMAKALVEIEAEGLDNIRLYNEEAGPLLDWLPEGQLDGFYLLYPDPWPKKRHFKRRFVNMKNLDRIARLLKPQKEFRFASDIDSYVKWTVDHCDRHSEFSWLEEKEENSLKPWENWPGTRYEAKALREARQPRYLTFLRK